MYDSKSLFKGTLKKMDSKSYDDLCFHEFYMIFYIPESYLPQRLLEFKLQKIAEMELNTALTNEDIILLIEVNLRRLSPDLREFAKRKRQIITDYNEKKYQVTEQIQKQLKEQIQNDDLELINSYYESQQALTDIQLERITLNQPLDENTQVKERSIYAQRLKYERESHGFTQQELGKLVGLTRDPIFRIEANQTKSTDYELLKQIARILDCEPDYFLGRTNDKKTSIAGNTQTVTLKNFISHVGLLPRVALNTTDQAIYNLICLLIKYQHILDEQDIAIITELVEGRLLRSGKLKYNQLFPEKNSPESI